MAHNQSLCTFASLTPRNSSTHVAAAVYKCRKPSRPHLLSPALLVFASWSYWVAVDCGQESFPKKPLHLASLLRSLLITEGWSTRNT